MKISIAILLCLVGLTIQQSESSTYTAGVVEFMVNEGETHIEKFDENTRNYIQIIEEAVRSEILVFPESTLNNYHIPVDVPRPHERIIPCGNNSYHMNLQNISCAAQRTRKYVVINLVMKRNCSVEKIENEDDRPCSLDEFNLYNTNVVFDRNGMVISTYRKFNLHESEPFNTTLIPDISTFTTAFNITFGHFTGFDILFESPAMDLLNLGVRNFIYPTRWYSEVPFLTALQIQEGWAIANDVNFLAAGANQPSEGSSGSGIYSGSIGALQSFVTGDTSSRLLIQDVPRTPGHLEDALDDHIPGTSLHNLDLRIDPVLTENYEHRIINTTNTIEQNFQLCQRSRVNQLCCNFRIQVTPRLPAPPVGTQYSYIAANFNGYRSFGKRDSDKENYVRICAVLACITNNITTCGTARPTQELVENNFQFTTIDIAITGASAEKDVAWPNTLIMNMLTLPKTYYNYEEIRAEHAWDFSTAQINMTGGNRHDLLTFGIYIRDFTFSPAAKLYAPVYIITLLIFIFSFIS